MTNCDPTPSAMVKLQGTIQAVSRMNFYLWMYLAQEGYFEEALEFVQEKLRTPHHSKRCWESIHWMWPLDATPLLMTSDAFCCQASGLRIRRLLTVLIDRMLSRSLPACGSN